MNIGWGAKIAMLYGGFVLMIGILVYKSTQEDFDLVATDYYQKELDYQNVIDAGRNQAQLSRPIDIMATEHVIGFDFPPEFQGKNLNGTIKFYAPMNEEW